MNFLEEAIKVTLKKRPSKSHKKSVGKIMIVAGSKGMTGAAVLTSRAAMRAGAGFVALAFPESLDDIFKELLPEIVTIPAKDHDGHFDGKSKKKILSESSKYDLIVIGPGISRQDSVQEMVLELVRELDLPLVIDADALFALSKDIGSILSRKGVTILTPHESEMANLAGLSLEEVSSKRSAISKKLAEQWNSYVVLKGNRTVVVSPKKEIYINETGGPALATAGTGDVLAGIIGALVSGNSENVFGAVSVAVYLHGLAGDIAARGLGERSVIASDVIEYLPQAITETQKEYGIF